MKPNTKVRIIPLQAKRKGMKIKITAIHCVSECLHFEGIKRLMSPEKFWDFRETGPWLGTMLQV